MTSNPSNPLSFLTFSKSLVKPPINTNSILHNNSFNKNLVAADAQSTHILIHPRFLKLIDSFLTHKRTHGSIHEKALYATLSRETQISRLIEKRPLVFMGSHDHTMLRNGKRIPNPRKQWDRNGTAEQDLNDDLTLQEYLSYDEIMLSSLIGVSGPSYFINDGARSNCGRLGKEGSFEDRGVIVGLVGARFEREDRMDSVFVLPPVERPRQHSELTRIFGEFFGAQRDGESEEFDGRVYRARMRVTADLLLLEADARARKDEEGKTAYVYVVGLGLGVWEYSAKQTDWYVQACVEAIDALPAGHRISTIEFAWIERNLSPQFRELAEEAGKNKGIKIIFSKRNPAAKLEDGRKQLLVLSYAWDGNAFPGNEYWQGSLMGSGDPAAACMSTIGELHNPLTNPYTDRIVVAGELGSSRYSKGI